MEFCAGDFDAAGAVVVTVAVGLRSARPGERGTNVVTGASSRAIYVETTRC